MFWPMFVFGGREERGWGIKTQMEMGGATVGVKRNRHNRGWLTVRVKATGDIWPALLRGAGRGQGVGHFAEKKKSGPGGGFGIGGRSNQSYEKLSTKQGRKENTWRCSKRQRGKGIPRGTGENLRRKLHEPEPANEQGEATSEGGADFIKRKRG